ncbi:MAG: glutathione S-transferase family protein [Marinobacterium sp.]|nr:glutathione S-transferase family protein [Marinobacterium sp.]
MELIIGDKNYSSWSLRGWMMLAAWQLPFNERKLPLLTDAFYEELEQYNAAAKVPILVDGDVTVWDSLAICEYISEQHLQGRGWPEPPAARAQARAVAAEMHSGFSGVRGEMPMNCRAKRRITLSEQARKDIQRIDQLWQQLRQQYAAQGPWLFGQFSIADVMFAPVVFRFSTYLPYSDSGIALSELSQQYADNMTRHPAMQQWLHDALKENTTVEEDEAGEPVGG